MSTSYQCMYLLTKEDYQKLKIASVAENNGGAGGGGEKKEQVNNIDVSHGGTLLINSKDFDGLSKRQEGGGGGGVEIVGGGGGGEEQRTVGRIMPVPVAAYPAAGMGQVEASTAAAKAEVKAEEEELKIREKQMMRALVEERLAQLGPAGVAQSAKALYSTRSTLYVQLSFSRKEGRARVRSRAKPAGT
jgi:hypothetical protein